MKRLLMVAAVVSWAAAAYGKESKPKPSAPAAGVNWEGQVLKATGSGAPDMKASSPAQARLGAETAAKMDAFRNLLAQAKGIQISSGKTVGDAMAQEETRGRVEGVIRGYKVTGKRYFSDQGVELDVEVPLSALAAALPEASGETTALKTEGHPKNTGLLVDARGLKVVPALAPRLLDESGKPVYGLDSMSEQARKTNAAASYFPSLEAARKSKLVGEKPLVIKAARAEGSDLVLGAEGVKQLSQENNSYLAEGRVAIVAN